MKLTRYIAGLCTALLLTTASFADQTYYLVRHAEKAGGMDRNPPLTEEGAARALWLAAYFSDKSLKAVYSTQYLRTEQTAAPTAEALGLTVQPYDPRDLPGFAETLKSVEGPVLIVGHSNTTPILAGILAHDPQEELDERVYDHIYVVTVDDAGHASLRIDHSDPRTVIED
jgi:phosphohistidine phosphatase SixA